MENHPIPQDITGFQFKLIGDMTIKQFAYLAAGVVLGWITFSLPIFFLIQIPLALLFIGLGVGTAFVPIEGRPFDLMVTNYLKALFNPIQYVYQKAGGHMWFPEPPKKSRGEQMVSQTTLSSDSTQRLKDFLKNLPQKPKNKLDEKELNFLKSLSSLQTSIISAPNIPAPAPQEPKTLQNILKDHNIQGSFKAQEPQEPIEQENVLKDQEEEIKKELEEAKVLEKTQEGSSQYSSSHQKVLELEKLLQNATYQKQNLENQILQLRKKMGMQGQKIYSPQTSLKTRVQMQASKKAPFFIPDVPNLIMGTAKDSRGNPLPNILVEVGDEGRNPVRAFKTSASGQFASATPLGNGVYTLSFEDPKREHKFNIIKIEVRGEVIEPLEIVSIDKREELRRELFNPPAEALAKEGQKS